MRKVTVYGINDGLSEELSRDVALIEKIMFMQESIAVNELTFKVIYTGSQLVNFINENKLDKSLIEKIKGENKYELTAYDW